jgi:UDP-glucose 6-dehydrogenase
MSDVAIGIIGYGVVGKAVHAGFNIADVRIVDPLHTELTVQDICVSDVDAIFVCIPTPDTDPTFNEMTLLLDEIVNTGYTGLIVVKSTALPTVLLNRPIVFNPEFLTHRTADEDFIHPVYVVVAGDRANELIDFYQEHSNVDLTHVYNVDIQTACFIKYVANTFYALKVTFMNEMAVAATQMGADYVAATDILKTNPAMGNNHMDVPGPDGMCGFGGGCLPKDVNMFLTYYNSELLQLTRKLNDKFRQ